MSRSDSIDALRRANPRAKVDLERAVEATAEALRGQIDTVAPAPPSERSRPRRGLVGVSAGASLAAAAAAAAILLVGSPGGGPGVESAAAAFEKAATLTAASAERSGTASVRIIHDGEPWAGNTIRWHDGDLATSRDAPSRHGKAGAEFVVVDGMMYGVDPLTGGWAVLGSPKSIDRDSGTTPDEYLAAVREDIGGATLRRFTDAMTGLTSQRLDDGATVYRGSVAAGLIARETGFKEGQAIRVLPFGYVGHDEAADPNAPLNVAVTIGAEGIVREIAVTWGTSASKWSYTVSYSKLGATSALTAPKNARPLRRP
jgi:hypothetical protein